MVGVVLQGNLKKNQAIQQLQLVMIQLCVVGSVDHPRLSRHAALPASQPHLPEPWGACGAQGGGLDQ